MIPALIVITCMLTPQQEVSIDREFEGYTLGDRYQDSGTGTKSDVGEAGSYYVTMPHSNKGERLRLFIRANGRISAIEMTIPIVKNAPVDSWVNQLNSQYGKIYSYRDASKADKGYEYHGWLDARTKIYLMRDPDCHIEGYRESAMVSIAYVDLDLEELGGAHVSDPEAVKQANEEKFGLRDVPLGYYPKLPSSMGEVTIKYTYLDELVVTGKHTVTDDQRYRYFTVDHEVQPMMLTFVKTGYREGYLYQIRIEQKDRARSLVINEIDSNGYKYAPWLVWKIRSVDGYVNVYDDGTNRFTEGYIGDQNAGIYLYQITEFPAWRTNWNATTNPYFYKSAVNPHRISEDNSTYFDGLFAPGQFSFPVGLGEIKLGGSFTKNDDWQQAGSRDGLTVYRYTYDSGDYYDVHVNADSTVVAVEFTLPNIGWDWTKDLRHYLYNNYAEFLTTNAGGQSGGSLVFKAVYHQTSMESILHLTWDDKQTAIKLASTGSL